ncbi:MAG: DUF2069 domain-containing protein [Lautropia sp.]|nr:DUF2069 domain-containing protein [Lautropia sp.]
MDQLSPQYLPSAPDEGLSLASQRWRQLSVLLIGLLILLDTTWELWLAPLRPGGSMLTLKVLPLVFALPALKRGWMRTYQLWSMLILLYLCEGIVRGMSDHGLSARLAWLEAALTAASYLTLMLYVRSRRTCTPQRASR